MITEQATKRIESHVKDILLLLGVPVDSPIAKETPDRVARMYTELFSEIATTSVDLAKKHGKTFVCKSSQLIIERDISFTSMCSHHIMPFFGVVHIGYVSEDKIIGLSKLARIVEDSSKTLATQEDLGHFIMHTIKTILGIDNVIVQIEAKHTCVSARGIKNVSANTITTVCDGVFLEQSTARQEFNQKVLGGK